MELESWKDVRTKFFRIELQNLKIQSEFNAERRRHTDAQLAQLALLA